MSKVKKIVLGVLWGVSLVLLFEKSIYAAEVIKADTKPSATYSPINDASELNLVSPSKTYGTQKNSNTETTLDLNFLEYVTKKQEKDKIREELDISNKLPDEAVPDLTVSEPTSTGGLTITNKTSSNKILKAAASALNNFQNEINLFANVLAGVLIALCGTTFVSNCIKLASFANSPIKKEETYFDIVMNLISCAGIGASRVIAGMIISIVLGN